MVHGIQQKNQFFKTKKKKKKKKKNETMSIFLQRKNVI